MKMMMCSGRSYLLAGLVFFSVGCIFESTFAADLKRAVVQKEAQYFQNGATAPTPDLNNGVSFEADVKSIASNTVTSATIQLPNGTTDTLPPNGNDEFKFKKKYNKQSSMDASFPNGSYTLGIQTVHDGLKTFVLALTGDRYPNTPQLGNWTQLQTLDAGTFTLCTWDPFTGGAADDFIQLHIDNSQGNKVWETPDLGEPGALDGRATATLIPARALEVGQSYQASLFFGKVTTRDRTSYPGAFGAAVYARGTKFTIQTIPTATRAEIDLYGVTKSRRYEQKDDGAPSPQTTKPFDIDVFVEADSAGLLTSASVILPRGAAHGLSIQSDGKTFDLSDDALLQSGLDATYPDGTYTLRVNTPATSKTFALDLSGDTYPPAPHVSKLPVQIDSSADFTVQWDLFAGGTSGDFVQLHIDDEQGKKVFKTPDFGKSGALNGSASEATVAARTLAPGNTYTARLVFQKNVGLNTTSYPGALGVASYAARTTFEVTTAGGGTPSAPHITLLPFSATGQFRLSVEALAGRTVGLQASSDLRQWDAVSSGTIPASGQLTMTESTVRDHQTRFYRVLLGP